MSAWGSLMVTDTLFLNNYAFVDGGGMYFAYVREVSITNTLLSRNLAGGEGEGIYVGTSYEPPYQVNIVHTTIVSPTSREGAAIYVISNTVNITNTLIASYTTGIEHIDGTVNEDFNLFFDVSVPLTGGVTSGGHSLIGDPAFLNPWIDDYHILSDSLALDAGFDLGITNDFEGDPRPQGLGPDIGYDELPFTLPNPFRLLLPLMTNQATIFWRVK